MSEGLGRGLTVEALRARDRRLYPVDSQATNAMLFLELLKFISFVPSPQSITVSSGTFLGVAVNGTDRWLGIPYAQPPVGPLRFKAPAVISRPTPGIQDAFQLSHACPQPTTTLPISEDCLYLNVCSVQIQPLGGPTMTLLF